MIPGRHTACPIGTYMSLHDPPAVGYLAHHRLRFIVLFLSLFFAVGWVALALSCTRVKVLVLGDENTGELHAVRIELSSEFDLFFHYYHAMESESLRFILSFHAFFAVGCVCLFVFFPFFFLVCVI